MPNDQALLVMDVQKWVVGHSGADAVLGPIASAQAAARGAGVPVVHVHIGFRPGYPEISDDNGMFSAVRSAPALGDPQLWEPCEPTQPGEGELVVVKHRVSAFSGSDLDMLLRSMGTRRLTLTGVATSGVVLSTVCEAADRDFVLTVLSDACADPVEAVHQTLIEHVLPMRAEVTTVASWSEGLG
jgi:nicotinamidase-related amidase